MNPKLIRVYRKIDIDDVNERISYGALEEGERNLVCELIPSSKGARNLGFSL